MPMAGRMLLPIVSRGWNLRIRRPGRLNGPPVADWLFFWPFLYYLDMNIYWETREPTKPRLREPTIQILVCNSFLFDFLSKCLPELPARYFCFVFLFFYCYDYCGYCSSPAV